MTLESPLVTSNAASTATTTSTRRVSRAEELRRFVKAQCSTGVATALEWLLVLLLARVGVWYVAAAIAGAVLGGITDFAMKKWWVFGTSRALAGTEAVRYAVVSGASALWYGAAMWLLVDALRVPLTAAVVGGSILVGLFWNYPLHRFFVFSHVRSDRELA